MSQKALLWMNRYLAQDALPPGAAAPPPEVSEEDMFGAGFNHEVTKRFLGFMKPYRRWVIIAISALMIFTLSQILFPLIIQKALDGQLTYFENLDSLELGVLLFAGVVVINFTSHFFSEWMVSKVAQRLLFDMRRGMFEHLQRVSLSFMDKTETGRLMSRLQGDVGALQEFLEALVYAIGDLVLLIGIIFVLLAMDLRLGAMTLALMPVLMIVRVFWLPHARKAFARARITSAIVAGTMCENIRGIRVVQGMTRERVNRNLYETKANDHFRTTVKAAAIAQLMLPTVDTLTGLALGIIALVGGNLVLQGELTAGVMVAYILYVQRFFDPIRALTLHYNAFLRAMASGERIFEVLDVPVGIQDKPDAKEIERSNGSVRFENVTFGYNPNYPVLHNINLEIPAGQTIALVGPTGCGKSSIASLIHRFYDSYEGKVLVGGQDTRSLTQQSLSQQIAMVLQDPYLFSTTILENIRYNKSTATNEEVIQASKIVGAHEFISRLPKGYETMIEERGSNFSLGQRQLISFARALVTDSPLLILDEATASIDSQSEKLLQEALNRLLENRTAVIIAHRLATIRKADKILVLQDGRIIESGNHHQLLKLGGLYAQLYSLNYASFDDIPQELIKKIVSE
ncbi:MAG TPA: multidrug ABC transporter [Deltaproteobacteria bacterium]|nr:multidrug ABC transporter [Deltaproteobacteria bacterium]